MKCQVPSRSIHHSPPRLTRKRYKGNNESVHLGKIITLPLTPAITTLEDIQATKNREKLTPYTGNVLDDNIKGSKYTTSSEKVLLMKLEHTRNFKTSTRLYLQMTSSSEFQECIATLHDTVLHCNVSQCSIAMPSQQAVRSKVKSTPKQQRSVQARCHKRSSHAGKCITGEPGTTCLKYAAETPEVISIKWLKRSKLQSRLNNMTL